MRNTQLVSALTIALLAGSAAQAKPAYKKALADHYGSLLVRSLDDCGTCHASKDAGELKFNASLANPHNAFGARLLSVVPELAKRGKPTDIATRLNAVAGEDSDRDGAANLAELLTGHRPGSAKDRPTAKELAAFPKLKAELARFRTAWAWKPLEPVRTPPVPRVKNAKWVRNPIDAFVLAEQEARGLKARPEAPREVLLRRLYLDLIGLPPTTEELSTFLADRSPGAYEKVVDRLLASPRYGERWGRHWMDVWRYSDWDGYGEEVRNSQRHIWRWRDWIIDSLNEDKGYDRMVQDMLAGDELAPGDPKVLPATGFLVRNWYVFSRHEMLTKVIDGTGKAFLGMTLNCAQCHDHKFDPISQKEYFNFRAFFEPFDVRTDRVPGQPDVVKDGIPHVYDANAKAETLFLIGGDDRKPDKNQPVAPGVPAAFGGPALRIAPVELPVTGRVPDKRPFVVEETLAASERAAKDARAKLTAAQMAPGSTPEALALAEHTCAAAETSHHALVAVIRVEQLVDGGRKDGPEWQAAAMTATSAQRAAAVAAARLNRLTVARVAQSAEAAAQKAAPAMAQASAAALAEARKKLEAATTALAEAELKAQQPVDTAYTPRPLKEFPAVSTGRRLALARWITDRQNPLAARVAVNHLWLRHFGRALAPTVTDFGANGQRPTHPALLDWLASTFMAGAGGQGSGVGGWQMKHLHRLIVTSGTYRMDSTHDTANGAIDPENRYLWRMNSRRMEAEVVRDSMLHASGQLDLTMGGPDLDQNLGLTNKRRSLYFRHSMEKQVEFLNTFDQVPPAECYERPETVMPQQALALANSALSVAQSRVLAGDLWRGVVTRTDAAEAFVSEAFLRILARQPSAEERRECAQFIREQTSRLSDLQKLQPFSTGAPNRVAPSKDAEQRARESLVHVLFNHHEFVTIR